MSYDIPPIERADQLPPSSLLTITDPRRDWLLELTFASIASTSPQVRDAAIQRIYEDRYREAQEAGE